MTDTFEMVAKTLHGLEEVLAEELKQLGADDIRPGRRMVAFRGDKRLLYTANLRLRTALRVLKPILKFQAQDADGIYTQMQRFDWSSVLSPEDTFAIDPVVYSETFRHSRYVGYRAKDAIADYFTEKRGNRPSVRLHNPDVLINIHISHQDVTVSLDSSGDSLHKRGYREAQTEAPLNEVLAAGIILKTGWKDDCDLIDPMCGSGTFLIEAALIAANIAPGIYRDRFAFQSWNDYDSELFDELFQDDSAERVPQHRICGSDILPDAIRIAQKNVDRSGLGKYITLEVMPVQQRPKPSSPYMVVTNPPYGERLRLDETCGLYSMIGECLKHRFGTGKAWILAHKAEHFNSIGLKPMHKEELMNGSLECELRAYDLFDGTFSEYRARQRKSDQSSDRSAGLDKRRSPSSTSAPEKPWHKKQDNRFRGKGKGSFSKDGSDFKQRDFRRVHRRDEERSSETFRSERRSSAENPFRKFDRGNRPNWLSKERPTRFGDDRVKDPNFYGQSRRKLPMEEATRERKRIGDYLSGKASQTMEMAKIRRIRSSKHQYTPWPRDRKKALLGAEKVCPFDMGSRLSRARKPRQEIQIIRNDDSE
ncbi:MAG: THUMP domain-containing protein [Porphyromonas sp.]|nr:THUMP domain-containing protein [Porphyromonas sp.]